MFSLPTLGERHRIPRDYSAHIVLVALWATNRCICHNCRECYWLSLTLFYLCLHVLKCLSHIISDRISSAMLTTHSLHELTGDHQNFRCIWFWSLSLSLSLSLPSGLSRLCESQQRPTHYQLLMRGFVFCFCSLSSTLCSFACRSLTRANVFVYATHTHTLRCREWVTKRFWRLSVPVCRVLLHMYADQFICVCVAAVRVNPLGLDNRPNTTFFHLMIIIITHIYTTYRHAYTLRLCGLACIRMLFLCYFILFIFVHCSFDLFVDCVLIQEKK